MFFALTLYVFGYTTSSCSLPLGKSVSLYVDVFCSNCTKASHQLFDIERILNQKNIITRVVDCDKCACGLQKIKKFPSLVISENREEKSRLEGNFTKSELTEFLQKNNLIDKKDASYFLKKSDIIKHLDSLDIERSLIGPWLIYVYKDKNESDLDILRETTSEFPDSIGIGAIRESEAYRITGKHGIKKFPSLVGLNSGVHQEFKGKLNRNSLKYFIESLVFPVLPEIDYEEYERKNVVDGVPMFILFYQPGAKPPKEFKQIANDFRFNAKMYQSSDPSFIDMANVNFTSLNKSVEPKQIFILAVAKKNGFHKLKITKFNYDKIYEWMWASQFPYVTQINHLNSSTFLKSQKPVVLLIQSENRFSQNLERFAENLHRGLPFVKYLFATMDRENLWPELQDLLKNSAKTRIIIFEPRKRKFFSRPDHWTDKNFEKNLKDTISSFELNILPVLEEHNPRISRWVYLPIVSILIFILYLQTKQLHGKLCKTD